ncbi:MAG: phosphodiester glycosidase family protein [Bacilli bacterium]|nr:phosphodiester glycosidase family protein [Bacilli bacterium]
MFLLDVASSCSDPGLQSILATVKRILSLFQIIGPILALVSFSIHLTHLVRDPDDKKRLPKLRNSAIALLVLFFIPMSINVLFGWLDDSTVFSSCWNSANFNTGGSGTYQPIDDPDKSQMIINPGDYEKGTPKPSYSPTPYSPGTSSSPGPGATSGTLVKQENKETLKVSIYKVNTYYITEIWVKNAYLQLNKYDSPNYGSSLYRPGDLLSKAVSQDNLSNKLVVGFNASGFYLKNTYDNASVQAYPAYDRTSVGSLVITNGRVVRNAYSHAVKTWYIAGVDTSNRLQIYEDAATKDASAKKAWSESVIGNIRNTFTFASPLVTNGQASSVTTSMPSPGSSLNRQAICQIDYNNFILITGSNLSRQDMINIMLNYHCQTGTNFDGGGSIALLYKGSGSSNIETIIGNRRSLTEVGYFTE